MKINSHQFEAFLKCQTKCYLRSIGNSTDGNPHAAWQRERNEDFRSEGIRRLREQFPDADVIVGQVSAGEIKNGKWRLALSLPVTAENLESHMDAVERIPAERGGKPSALIPMRFTPLNKLTRNDRLLLAFDALVLSKATGWEINRGKLVHRDHYATALVRIKGLLSEVRKLVAKVEDLVAGPPPDREHNRHCEECEFRNHCHQVLISKDDLSLLATMRSPERKEYHSKGIFTVMQLSYTFRPRRRPKHLRDKREKYHHALKALALREKKTYIVGKWESKS